MDNQQIVRFVEVHQHILGSEGENRTLSHGKRENII